MEKLKTLAFILFGLAVFVWQMIQKARALTQKEQRERKLPRPNRAGQPRPAVPLPSTSFEEMLRQMQSQNSQQSAKTTTPAGRPLPRETAPAPHSLEVTDVQPHSLEEPAVHRSYAAPAPEAHRATELPRASTRPAFAPYQRPRPAAGPPALAELLRNPADLRAAFVLSEILQRKF